MNLYVCIKQVPDTETKIKLNADSSGIDSTGIKWIMSSYDEYGVEEALRIKEKNPGATVTAVSAGPDRVVETLRTALAMGADNAIHVELPETADSSMAAKAIAMTLKKEAKVDLVFFGKEALDDGAAQVPQLVAAHLGIPAVTVVCGMEYAGNTLKCKREIEGGSFEMVEVSAPAVIAGSKGLNDPRYATLPNIMKAKKKEVKAVKLAEIGVSSADQKVKMKNLQLPAAKQAGKKLEGDAGAQAHALATALHNEAKVV
ncbi:MAG: electron transfer flavoprotein subunit beta/FixA family protein [Bdellovibrionales bacterium]|nr:electron transfer flavoprotein subunit beta/FixA family protein [Bdellovibrionales bacterium]